MAGCAVAVPAFWFLVLSVCGTKAASHASHLRAHTAHWQQPPAGVAAAPAVSDLFAKMDVNKDGKVDVNEFVVAQNTGILPLAAPAPAGVFAASPFAAPAPAPAPMPMPGAADEVLPPHLMHPPPLPSDIPEPPPPPRPPPAEPMPPPQPPKEGQLVQAPPSDESVAASGVVNALTASGVPGLDLDGNDPLQVPNTPPPIPPPMLPPDMPKLFPPLAPPSKPDKNIMGPSPVSFGVDIARTLNQRTAEIEVVPMPTLPDSSFLSGS